MALWLAGGIAMVIMGIAAIFNRDKAMEAVSSFLGVCALITGIVTLGVRITQLKMFGRNGRFLCMDGIIWLLISILLFNTSILNKLGKLAFIIGGVIILYEGVRSFHDALKDKQDQDWYIPRIIFSVIFAAVGLFVIFRAEWIFKNVVVFSIGIYFIIHGASIIYDWIGRYRYFRNFRNLD